MRFLSTRDESDNPATVDICRALRSGLAADGGLYVPETLPDPGPLDLAESSGLPETAAKVLEPFFADSGLAAVLPSICREAMDLPLPLDEFEPGGTWMLELFHGPTAAFKDFAARFLASCLGHLRTTGDPVQTVLVATSGDTGGAVAAAFHRRPGFRVVILYPDERVSARQAHQLGAFGDNIHTFRVQGDFDDCQRLAKQALEDRELNETMTLTSANSISIGRLLPQVTYYVHAISSMYRKLEKPVDVIVPTGNLGNALACDLARRMGMPLGELVLATNANRTLSEYFSGRDYQGRPGLATLANAMDVGDPSNFERLAWFYRHQDLRSAGISAVSIDDGTIGACIRRVHADTGRVICPHTACAVAALHRRREAGNTDPCLVVATAHAAKFDNVVEPLLGKIVTPPPALAALLGRKSRAGRVGTGFDEFREILLDFPQGS